MTPRLTTERLVLRGLGTRDVDRLLAFDTANRAFLAPWEPARDDRYLTAERVVRSIRGDAGAAKRGDGYRWHLFLAGDPDTIIGSVSLSNIVRGVFLSCHLGYRLGESWTGRGAMTEAVQRVLDQAFGPLGLHRVEANVLPRNRASRAVLRRLGFEEEGLCRTYLKINGVWEDHLRHVRFAPGS
jgi:ribosomal-protein-alanine N-acetyltransferase